MAANCDIVLNIGCDYVCSFLAHLNMNLLKKSKARKLAPIKVWFA
jgi:hypothetical protein